jgi:phosphohistidine phosphatase SixA
MKTLLVLRHAKSSWNDTALDDHERPLNKRGRRHGPRMGSLVCELGLTPDVIISSTAVRARLTAEAQPDVRPRSNSKGIFTPPARMTSLPCGAP